MRRTDLATERRRTARARRLRPLLRSDSRPFLLDSGVHRGCILLDAGMHRVHLLISGRVQGVGFRYYVVDRARHFGLSGWVGNRSDGAVEVEAEGDLSSLRQFVEAARRGPRAAAVANVEESWSEGPARHRGFTVTT